MFRFAQVFGHARHARHAIPIFYILFFIVLRVVWKRLSCVSVLSGLFLPLNASKDLRI